MTTEIEGMKVVISADASQAIRTIQDFQNKFRSMANSINGTMMNANVNMTDFNKSVGSMGSIANIAQMQNVNNSMKKTNQTLKGQGAQLEKNKKHWKLLGIASVAALYGIIRGSSLAQMWMAELSGIFGYFLDTALSPLSSGIEFLLNILWTLSDWFSGFDPIIQGAVGVILILSGAILTFISWLTGATGLSIITGAFNLVAGAIAGLAAIIGLPVEAVIVIIAAVGVALYLLWKNWDEVIAWLGKAWDWLGTKVGEVWEGIKKYFSDCWEGLKNDVSNAWNYIKNIITGAVQSAYDTIVGIISKIRTAITSVPGVQTAINIATNAYQGAKSYLGYAQGTDYVPQTGIYRLHEGEKVIPKGENNTNNQSVVFNNTFTINNPTMRSDSDVKQLAMQISSLWRDDMVRKAGLGRFS